MYFDRIRSLLRARSLRVIWQTIYLDHQPNYLTFGTVRVYACIMQRAIGLKTAIAKYAFEHLYDTLQLRIPSNFKIVNHQYGKNV